MCFILTHLGNLEWFFFSFFSCFVCRASFFLKVFFRGFQMVNFILSLLGYIRTGVIMTIQPLAMLHVHHKLKKGQSSRKAQIEFSIFIVIHKR
jgi:hypothetical protein